METNQTNTAFLSDSVPKAVLKNALPAIMAMLMTFVYNIADTFFIGQTHNDYMVAAVSICTPVFLIFTALGTLFGAGGVSVISRAMGEGRPEYAKRVCAFCFWACVAVGIVLTGLFWLLMDPLLALLGAGPETAALAETYLTIVIGCGTFSIVSNCFSNIIRAEGRSTTAMAGTILGNLVNVVLDPILILACGWDIAGAAIATVIGNICGALFYLIYFWRGRSILSIRRKDAAIRDGVMKSVLAIGIPASLGNLLMSVSQMVTNSRMADFGDLNVAAYGVASKILMIVASIGVGLGMGVQPLLGFCFGAGEKKRFRSCLRFSALFGTALCILICALCIAFAEPIVGFFLTDVSALEASVTFVRILFSTAWLLGIFFVCMNAIQAMGAARSSLIISLSRQGFIYIPALLILGAILGKNGLVWAQPAADVLSLVIVAFLLGKELKRNH